MEFKCHRFFACVIFINIGVVLFVGSRQAVMKNFKEAVQQIARNESTKTINESIILMWNSFYTSPTFGMPGRGREAFIKAKCSVNNCRLETDRTLLDKASVVVFHIYGNVDPFPRHANHKQVFVYFLLEPPTLITHGLGFSDKIKDEFNLTMTYRSDSDIPVPLARLFKVKSDSDVKPYKMKYHPKTKDRDIAWMVSHCYTASKREQYVKKLSKYINIDVYGRCGNFTCLHNETWLCMNTMEKKYKFYLAFENSVCDDYVTEKLFRTLHYEMIPIVYGGADYRALVPPHSYIDILDYASPRELVAYLREVANNDTKYAEFFAWKPYFKENDKGKHLVNGFCKLCEMVRNDTEKFKKSYKDVHSWWSKGRCHNDIVDKVIGQV